jgi:Eukaryotic-type DNA primase, large subunit
MRYEFSEINKDHFPPCMKFLVSEIKRGSNISHSGRFALTSFLSSVGMSRDEIIKIYRSSPDFDEEKTRYQVEHITGSSGTVYRCPSCATMKTYGNCIGEDEDCRWVSNPMGRYYKGLKKQLSTKKEKTNVHFVLKNFRCTSLLGDKRENGNKRIYYELSWGGREITSKRERREKGSFVLYLS